MDTKAIARGYDSEQQYVISSGSQPFLNQGNIQSTPTSTEMNGKIDASLLGGETQNPHVLIYAHGLKTEPESVLEARPILASTPKHYPPESFPGFGVPFPDHKSESLSGLYGSNLSFEPSRPSCCQKKHEHAEDSFVVHHNQGNSNFDSEKPVAQNMLGKMPTSSGIYSSISYDPSPHATFEPKINYGHMLLDHQWIPHLDQTTLYTLPPTYATASHPLNPLQLAQLQHSHSGFSQMVPQYAPSGLMGSAAPSADGSMIFNPAHNCNCGDNCLCLGCAAHPYNATTRHHVQDLRQILENSHETTGSSSRPQSSYGSPINMIDVHRMTPGTMGNIKGDLPSPARSDSFQMSSLTGSNFHQPSDNSSPTQATFPVFSSSGYYTMEFPMEQDFSMGCTDVSGSCKCGSDCACIGCLTHTGHDGNTLTDRMTEQEQPDQAFDPVNTPTSDPPTPVSATPHSSCCG